MNILRIWRAVLDTFFPPLCIKCKNHLKNEEKSHLLCRTCFDSININRVIIRPDKDTTLFAVGRYDDIALRELIHCLKYNKFTGARNTIRALIKKYLSEIDLVAETGKDAILIPIPLHPARRRERGFNQSEIIATELSRLTGLRVDSTILCRVKNIKPQIEKRSEEARKENVKDAFEINPIGYSLLAKNLILVDDVYTSGATMNEAIRALKHAGAKNIFGFVIGKT